MAGPPAIDEKLAKEPRVPANGAPPVVATETPAPDAAAAKKAKDRQDVTEYARREQARIARERARDAETAQLRAQVAASEETKRALAQLQQQLSALEADPLDYLEKRGVTARQLGERILKKSSPEAQNEEIERRIKEANDNADRIRQELERRDTEARNAHLLAQARKQMYDAHDASKDKTPLLAKKVGRDRERLVAEYMATYSELLKDPELVAANYTDEEILLATEERLRLKAEEELDDADDDALEKRLTARKARVASTAESAEASADATGRQGTETASSRKAAPLVQATSSGSSGGWRPENWDKLSDKEQNKILAERMRKKLPFD